MAVVHVCHFDEPHVAERTIPTKRALQVQIKTEIRSVVALVDLWMRTVGIVASIIRLVPNVPDIYARVPLLLVVVVVSATHGS